MSYSADKLCLENDCPNPRAVSKSGKVYGRCREHLNVHQRQLLQARNGAPKPRQLTKAQQAIGMTSDPIIAQTIGSNFKICLINYDADTMTFVEGKVTRRCKTDALKLLPGGWEILLEGHKEEGYLIVERGTPPVKPGLTASYDWRD